MNCLIIVRAVHAFQILNSCTSYLKSCTSQEQCSHSYDALNCSGAFVSIERFVCGILRVLFVTHTIDEKIVQIF
jgi:hypothetical protein